MITCSKCGETKPSSAFTPDKKRASGFAGHCKACKAARQREIRRIKSAEDADMAARMDGYAELDAKYSALVATHAELSDRFSKLGDLAKKYYATNQRLHAEVVQLKGKLAKATGVHHG